MTRLHASARIAGLAGQRDVRAHPLRSVYRRLRWRAHWSVTPKATFHVQHWTRGMSIDLPRSGAAAQVYYRVFSSPRLAQELIRVLRPGMTMIDIGAHVGEYSLLAAVLVGSRGHVSAVEPQPQLAELIRHNARLNDLTNVGVHALAVTDHDGTSGFEIDSSSGGGWLRAGGDARTTCTSLDALIDSVGGRADFLKLDVAGNESVVLAGGQRSLLDSAIPRIAYKLYHPGVASQRFGHDSLPILEQLSECGYEQRLLTDAMDRVHDGDDAMAALGSDWYSVPVLAVRRPDRIAG